MESERTIEDKNRWLTRREVAQLLRVSISTLERWERQGTGPKSYRVGGIRLLRYDRNELDAWIEREGN